VAWARGDCAGAEAPKPTHPEGILQRLRGKGSQCEGANLEIPNPQFEFRNKCPLHVFLLKILKRVDMTINMI
jgi:hypothetical protein